VRLRHGQVFRQSSWSSVITYRTVLYDRFRPSSRFPPNIFALLVQNQQWLVLSPLQPRWLRPQVCMLAVLCTCAWHIWCLILSLLSYSWSTHWNNNDVVGTYQCRNHWQCACPTSLACPDFCVFGQRIPAELGAFWWSCGYDWDVRKQILLELCLIAWACWRSFLLVVAACTRDTLESCRLHRKE